jgi:hypothetical protein
MFLSLRVCAPHKTRHLQKRKKHLENKGEMHIAFLRGVRRAIVDDEIRAGRALPTPSIANRRRTSRRQNSQEMGCTNFENSYDHPQLDVSPCNVTVVTQMNEVAIRNARSMIDDCRVARAYSSLSWLTGSDGLCGASLPDSEPGASGKTHTRLEL